TSPANSPTTSPRRGAESTTCRSISSTSGPSAEAESMAIDRAALAGRGRRLEYFTIGWNSLEGLVAVGAGALGGRISLVGFGVDSFIEVSSGAALLWRMAVDADACQRERRERLTLRIVGVSFLALAAYVTWSAIGDLVARSAPDTSRPGMALACASLI